MQRLVDDAAGSESLRSELGLTQVRRDNGGSCRPCEQRSVDPEPAVDDAGLGTELIDRG